MKKIKYALALAGLLTSGWCFEQQIVTDSQPGLTKERIANMYMISSRKERTFPCLFLFFRTPMVFPPHN